MDPGVVTPHVTLPELYLAWLYLALHVFDFMDITLEICPLVNRVTLHINSTRLNSINLL